MTKEEKYINKDIKIEEYDIDFRGYNPYSLEWEEAHFKLLINGVSQQVLRILNHDEVVKQYIFIDLTDWNARMWFEQIQKKETQDDFFNRMAHYFFDLPHFARYNSYFVFIVDDNFKNKYSDLEYDLNYARKIFFRADEVEEFKNYIKLVPNQDFKIDIVYENIEASLGKTNLIYGGNVTGKTILLKNIAKKQGAPLFFSMDDLSREQLQKINLQLQTLDKALIEKYLKHLSLACPLSISDELNNFDDLFYQEQCIVALAMFIAENAKTDKILLLDNPFAICQSDIFILNLFDTLFYHPNPTLITSCNNQYEDIYYVKTLRPNVINLNEQPLFRPKR